MLQKNRILEKLINDKPTLGGWVLTGSGVAAEMLALSGFDWVCIDAEHSAITTETAQQIMVAIERHGAEPIVRISGNHDSEIKKFLDMGARGILVPMIKSYEDVEKAVSSIKFPPEGNRSYSLSRSTEYGLNSSEYFLKANDSIFFLVS